MEQHDPKHTISSVKHGGGSFMAWPCMAATGTCLLVLLDDVTGDNSSWMNTKVYRNILSYPSKCIKTDWTMLHHSKHIDIPT